MRFKPMQFSNTDVTVEQTNRCNSFQLSPAAGTIPFSQKGKDANPVAYGDYFDVRNLANDFEVHQKPLYLCHSFMQARANGWRYPLVGGTR